MKPVHFPLIGAFAVLCALVPMLLPAGAHAGSVPYASDLNADAKESRSRALPILVMFNSRSCPYCEFVMEHYIEPMAQSQGYADKVIVRVVDVDGYRKLVDFSGSERAHSDFAEEQRASLTPVIKFFGPDGRELTEQLLGFTNEHFYGYYLDAKIDESLARLRPLAANP